MSVYKYNAIDSEGHKKEGSVDANSKELALGLLKEKGLFVVSLEKSDKDILQSLLSFRGVPQDLVVSFTRQFSTMISAGLPIARSLEVLVSQTDNYKFKQILTSVLRDIEGGISLSASLTKYPDVFSNTYQSLVRAGEASGNLHTVLNRLADTMESERELQSKFKSAMIYPIIVLVAMVGVFILMMIVVVPKLTTMYDNMNVPLPIQTKIMIVISEFMTQNTVVTALIGVSVIIGFRYFTNTDFGKNFFTELSFKLPVFGKINRNKETTSFSRTLSLLINSAIPIVEALNIVSDVVRSSTMKQAVLGAAEYIEKGNSLSDFFRGNKAFPPLLGQMAGVGEETGKMDEVLGRVADYYEGETSSAIENLSAALEPIILLLLGSMVGVLIFSIITPIYKITTSI